MPLVQPAHIDQIGSAKPFAVAQAEVAGQLGDDRPAVRGPGFAALLKLHNLLPDPCIPVAAYLTEGKRPSAKN